MGAPQYEQAGADVAGSGTAGTIPVWATATTLGDSLLSQSGAIVTNSGTFRAASGAVGEPAYTFAASTGTGMYRATSGALLRFAVSGAYAFGVDTSGNVAIGTTAAASASSRLTVVGGFIVPAAGFGVYQAGDHLTLSGGAGKNVHLKPNDGGVLAVNVGATSCDMSAVAGYGLKLPATPGNADAQTLDCYQENPLATTAGNGWTPTIGGTAAQWGGTLPTVSFARYVQIGSIVFCDVRLTSASIQSTYGLTTITPPPPAQNAFATEAVVPASTTAGGVTGNGAQFGGVVYLPTLAASTAIRLTWFYFTTS